MQVELKELTKIFEGRGKGNPQSVIAVDNFTFTIEDGSLVGLLGPSGCGKSTTLNLISGLIKPTSGRIFFGEEDVTDMPPERRGVGMVFQNYALYPHMTVLENIIFPLGNIPRAERPSRAEMVKRAEEVARLVQIEGLLERHPAELSGGQQQRVAIARALVKTPRVLLLDEPLSNLDARLRLKTREEIRRIQLATGVTTIFVTHDQEEAMSISDMIVVMKDGVVQQIGAPQEVYDDPANLFVAEFLGTPPISVFLGEVRGGGLYIGEERVLSVSGASEGEVYVTVRPEGYVLNENGEFTCTLGAVEVMGRDMSVVATHPRARRDAFRAIVPSDSVVSKRDGEVRFSLRPSKVDLYDVRTELRIRAELS